MTSVWDINPKQTEQSFLNLQENAFSKVTVLVEGKKLMDSQVNGVVSLTAECWGRRQTGSLKKVHSEVEDGTQA